MPKKNRRALTPHLANVNNPISLVSFNFHVRKRLMLMYVLVCSIRRLSHPSLHYIFLFFTI